MAVLRNLMAHPESWNFEAILEKLNMIYLVQDARQLPLPDASVDLVHSNNTFEHVYPHILKDLPQNRYRLSEYQRLYAEIGLPVTDLTFRPGDLAALNSVRLNPKYAAFDKGDLAVSHCLLVSKM